MLGQISSLAVVLLMQSAGTIEAPKATGPWAIDYGVTACTLSRELDSGQMTFALRRQTLERQSATAMLRGPATDRSRDRQFRATLVIDDEAIKIEAETRGIPDGDSRVVTVNLNKENLAKLETAGTIMFPVAADEHVRLNLGNLDDALGALSKCSDDLVGSLGVPAKELDAISTEARPIGNIDISPRRFVEELRGKRWEAKTSALFEIDASGTVTGCRIVTYSGPEQLRGYACAEPYRMRFEPARSGTGAPVRSWVVLAVTTSPCVGRKTRNEGMTC